MSLVLDCGSSPEGMTVKTHSLNSSEFTEGGIRLVDFNVLENNVVHLSVPGRECVCITMEDFLSAVHYALTNTDLEDEKDPRLFFLQNIKDANITTGFNPSGKRIEFPWGNILTHKKQD